MTIKVTQGHINRGARFNSESCPIALALMDNGIHGFRVAPTYARRGYPFVELNEDEIISLPEKATDFIRSFDGHKAVEPFEFDFPYTPEGE